MFKHLPNKWLRHNAAYQDVKAMISAEFRQRHAEAFETMWEAYLRVTDVVSLQTILLALHGTEQHTTST